VVPFLSKQLSILVFLLQQSVVESLLQMNDKVLPELLHWRGSFYN